MTAVVKYGIPSRLRIDKGGENWDIAQFMVDNRGTDRKSVITGKSVHNQRIERFWRDVRKEVLNYYIDLFDWFIYGDEEEDNYYNGLIDLDNPRDIFCLHYLFIPRINEDLETFQEVWNLHKLSTEKNKSPYQLLRIHEENSGAIPFVNDEEEEVDDQYGNFYSDHEDDDYANNSNCNNQENLEQVVLEPIKCPLNAQQFDLFSNNISSIALESTDRNYFVQCINNALNFFNEITVNGDNEED